MSCYSIHSCAFFLFIIQFFHPSLSLPRALNMFLPGDDEEGAAPNPMMMLMMLKQMQSSVMQNMSKAPPEMQDRPAERPRVAERRRMVRDGRCSVVRPSANGRVREVCFCVGVRLLACTSLMVFAID